MLANPSSSSTTTAPQGTSRDPAVVDASYHEASRQSDVPELAESTDDKGKAVYMEPPVKGKVVKMVYQ